MPILDICVWLALKQPAQKKQMQTWTVPGYVQDVCVDIVPSTAKPCTVRLGLLNADRSVVFWYLPNVWVQIIVAQFTSTFFLGGGFKYFLFSPLLGEIVQFD